MTFTNNWPALAFTVYRQGDSPRMICPKGQNRWALEALMAAGPKGCTPICAPGPRWAVCVHKLRKLGAAIDAITETHDGPFSGHHDRYVLACSLMPYRKRRRA